MSQPSPYEQLGIREDASTEEILEVRNRLLSEADSVGDRQQRDRVEAAYDAVLMDRLRLRQEGKIKVPDRIRFPEKAPSQPPSFTPPPPPQPPTWLSQWVSTPTTWKEFTLPTVTFVGLGALAWFYPTLQQLALMAGVVAAIYFIYKRERRMGKAILLGLAGLFIGFLAGGLLWTVFKTQLMGMGLQTSLLDSLLVMFFLWLLSNFAG
jgi:hypothetical protein